MIPDDLTRLRYGAELERHRDNLIQALKDTRNLVDAIQQDVEATSGQMHVTSKTRKLLLAAGDAAQAAGALSAAAELFFTVDPASHR